MNTNALLTEDQLVEVAFDLITSSAIRRYAQMAEQAATKFGLVAKLLGDRAYASTVLGRAHDLLSYLAPKSNREPEEFELATLVAALSVVATDSRAGVHDSFRSLRSALQKTQAPALLWIRALFKQGCYA